MPAKGHNLHLFLKASVKDKEGKSLKCLPALEVNLLQTKLHTLLSGSNLAPLADLKTKFYDKSIINIE